IIIQKDATPHVGSLRWRELIPTKTDMRNSAGSWVRGSGIGFMLGLLPGPSISLATLLSYRTESLVGRDRQNFGKGAVSGLAGPESVSTNPDLFWGLIASLLIGNVMLLVLNINLIRVWVAMLRVPNWVLLPSVVALCWAGVYAFRMSWFDLVVAAALGVIGFFMLRYKF